MTDPQSPTQAPKPEASSSHQWRETLPCLVLRERHGASKPGFEWEVAIIEAGASKNTGSNGNPRVYGEAALRASMPLFDGARVFAYELGRGFLDHKPEQVQKSLVKNLVGSLSSPRMIEVEGTPTMVATLKVLESATWARDLLMELARREQMELVGLSIDAAGREQRKRTESGQNVDEVIEIAAVESVDLVSSPAAGGRFLRLVASEGTNMKGTLWKILSQLAPSVLDDLEESSVDAELLVAKFDEALADEALAKFAEQEAPPYKLREILELRRAAKMLRGGDVKGALDLIEQIIGAAGEPEPEAESDPETEPTQESKPEPEPKKEASMSAPKTEAPVHTDGLTEAERARLAELEHEASELRVDRMVESTALPPAIKNKLRESFRGKVVDRDAIQGAIKAELDAFEALKRDGVIHDPGAHAKGVSLIESGYTKLDKFQIGMHKLVSGSEVLTDKEKAAGVPAFRGIREAYETITGDTEHRGRIDRKRISQDYFAVLKEAVDTAGFPQILANTLNRKMVRDYNMLNFQWRDFVNTSSARDFRNQELVRFGGYLNLATVAESAAYPALASPTDENVQYSVVKRGGTETVTFEVIKNDDVRFVQKIPTRMARAAARTLEQRAMDLILSYTAAINDTNVYDGTVLYDAAHNNITATALTWGNVWAAIEAMGQQTEADSAEPLGVRPKYLLVPPQLEQEAREIVESTDRPDTGDRATNTLRGMVEVRVNHFLRGDATNWYLIADPAQNETIEISFLDGKQEPEMLVQDTPTVDNVFTNDIITYRVRHIYEGAVVDYRSFYGAIVP